jgi:hypothetical protein
MQAASDGGGHAGPLPAGRLAQAGVIGVQVGQGAQAASAAVVSQPLQRGQLPLPVLAPGVPAHAPLDLGPQQRVQAPEVDLVGPQHRRSRRAPPAEGRLVGVLDGDGPAGALVAVPPLAGQGSASRSALPAGSGRRAASTAPAARTPSQGRRGRGSGRSQGTAPAWPATDRSRRRRRAGAGSYTSGTGGGDTAAVSDGRTAGPGRSGTAAPPLPRPTRGAGPPAGTRPASRPRPGACARAPSGRRRDRRAPSPSARIPPGSSTGRRGARQGS